MPSRLARLVLATALLVPLAVRAADKEKYEVGEEVPNFLLKPVNADAAKTKVFSLDTYVGSEATDKKKAVILSFFATYCEPCKREMPYLEALWTEFKDKGLMVASISIDKDDAEIKKVGDLAIQNKLDYPVLSDHFNIVAKRYFVQRLPNLYILDENGKVSKVSIGYDENAKSEILSEVRKTLGLPVSDPPPASLASFLQAAPAGKTGATPAVANGDDKPAAQTAAADDDGGKKGKRGKKKSKLGRNK